MTGEEFKRYRHELELTQEELGNMIGLSRVTAGTIERSDVVSVVHSNLIGYVRLSKAVREYNHSADSMTPVIDNYWR